VSSPVFHATTVTVPLHPFGGQNTWRCQSWHDSEGQRSSRGGRSIFRNEPRNIRATPSPGLDGRAGGKVRWAEPLLAVKVQASNSRANFF
jgi:hypothetical protein